MIGIIRFYKSNTTCIYFTGKNFTNINGLLNKTTVLVVGTLFSVIFKGLIRVNNYTYFCLIVHMKFKNTSKNWIIWRTETPFLLTSGCF